METVLRGTRQEVIIGPGRPFCIIGERINPTNKARLTKAISDGDWSYLQDLAKRQVEAGAHVIDINVGVPGVDEPETMRSAVRAVQEIVDVPISIDSSTIEVLLAGMEVVQGRALVNSVPAEEEYMRRLLPAIKDHGFAMIGICMRGGANMPVTVEERMEIAHTLLSEAQAHGIEPKDVIIDVLILPLGADHMSGRTTVDSIKRVTTELGTNTSVGLSNLSFGLPDRSFLNAIMLATSVQAGLTAAIMDPLNKEVRMAVSAADMIGGLDAYSVKWIAQFREREAKAAAQARSSQ